MDDAAFMRIAIEESKKGDWPYGAVIVKDGAIVVKYDQDARLDAASIQQWRKRK